MIIESLKINNYRVFSGEHQFDLSPRVKYGQKRPIILFGGLNGAGKTSILSAIRLALYGKQSLGIGISQKSYEEFLSTSIHRGRNSKVDAHSAAVELSFTYAKLGEKFSYIVTREWMRTGKNIKEVINISENGKSLDNLSYEQCQGFLNELIPIGLSNLFFFDGEKIKELAEDAKGIALGDAIKKLIGLDQFDILKNDLGVLIRNNQPDLLPKEISSQVKYLEGNLSLLNTKISESLSEFESTTITWNAITQDLEIAENEFRNKGGAWVNSYEAENQAKGELIGEKASLEKIIREQIATDFPLAIIEKFNNKVIAQLNLEKQEKSKNLAIEHLSNNITPIKEQLILNHFSKKDVNKCIEILSSAFSKNTEEHPVFKIIHEISEPNHYRIINKLNDAKINFSQTLEKLSELNHINDEIDQLGHNLSRAPTQESIQKEFDEISKLKDKQSSLQLKRAKYAEIYRRGLQEKLTLLRQLDNLTESLFSNEVSDRTIDLAGKSRTLIKDFGSRMAEAKVKDLETEFVNSFERLARKDDIKLQAKIDPKTFSVNIVRDDNHIVDKNELSAGEKQIYAIAILEALAKTSGRKLPIIIDTPLGRLDSLHRNKLIQNYFPNASHQVIILSTDTEVDEAFYSDLSKHISHAYRLDYDSISASTQAIEGYFWKNKTLVKEVV